MKVRIKEFNASFEDLWRKYKLFIIFSICAFLFDTLSTIHFMTIGGIHLEIHPLVKYSALFLGPISGTIMSAFMYKTFMTITLAIYLRHLRLWILILPASLSVFAGFYNLFT